MPNSAETFPLQLDRPETAYSPDHPAAAHIGSMTLHESVDSYVEAGLDMAEAHANNVDARQEDAGRIHDIDKAHEAALKEEAHAEALIENEIFGVYDEAAAENKAFDHAEAIRENEARTAALREKQKATELAEAEEAVPTDVREQAKQALKEVGYNAGLPSGSQVQKDPEGNLVVTLKDTVKVIEPQANGRPRVTDYAYSRSDGVLRITKEGRNDMLMTVKEGEYMSASRMPEGSQPPSTTVITLPRSVSRVVGFTRAVFVQ